MSSPPPSPASDRDPATVARVAAQVSRLAPVDEREAAAITATLAHLTRPGDPFSETADPHHVTASAFVISSRGVLLHRHRLLGLWLQPGGHVDAGEDPEVAALREVREETGLVGSLAEDAVWHVDVHPGPRGHTHYDLRYLVAAPPANPRPEPRESPDVRWCTLDEAVSLAEPTLGAALRALATKGVR